MFHDCGRLDPVRLDLRSVRTLCELTVTMVFAPLVSVSAANANSGVSAGDPDVDIHYGQRIPIRGECTVGSHRPWVYQIITADNLSTAVPPVYLL